MSATFLYEIINPAAAKSFAHGTSSDVEALTRVFGNRVSTKDIPTLRAMHLATSLTHSLWNDIADTLERLQGDDYEKEVTLKIWVEY